MRNSKENVHIVSFFIRGTLFDSRRETLTFQFIFNLSTDFVSSLDTKYVSQGAFIAIRSNIANSSEYFFLPQSSSVAMNV